MEFNSQHLLTIGFEVLCGMRFVLWMKLAVILGIRAKQIEQTRQLLEDGLGRPPTAEEMANEMGVELEEFFVLEGKVQSVQTVSLDWEDSEGRRPFIEALADEHSVSAEDLVMQDDFRVQVRAAIQGLSNKKRDCILLYYGRNLNLSAELPRFLMLHRHVSARLFRAARKELQRVIEGDCLLYMGLCKIKNNAILYNVCTTG